METEDVIERTSNVGDCSVYILEIAIEANGVHSAPRILLPEAHGTFEQMVDPSTDFFGRQQLMARLENIALGCTPLGGTWRLVMLYIGENVFHDVEADGNTEVLRLQMIPLIRFMRNGQPEQLF